MPQKKEFLLPAIHALDNNDNIQKWSEYLIRILISSFRDIDNFKMSVSGTARVTTQTLAAGFTINSDGLYVFVDSTAPVTSDASVAIADGATIGDQLIIMNTTTNAVTIKTSANTRLGTDIVLAVHNSLWVVWTGSNWRRVNAEVF